MDTAEKLKSLIIDRQAAAPVNRRWLILTALAAIALAGAAAVLLLRTGDLAPANVIAAPAAATPVAPVAQADSRGGLVASGYVVARRSATLSADITGRLVEILFEEGAEVVAGQPLARLDSTLAAYDLRLAQARLETAQANEQAIAASLPEAARRLARMRRLAEGGGASQAALEGEQVRVDTLSAQHQAALSEVATAKLAVQRQSEYLARHEIRAPFAGRIIAKNAQAGEILSPSAGGGQFTRTGVATLVDMASLEVEVDVNEGQIADIVQGQAAFVTLDAYPADRIPAEVLAIVPTANRDRATIRVRVGFARLDPKILPEMAAKVTFDRQPVNTTREANQ